jgi:hypothetical protein
MTPAARRHVRDPARAGGEGKLTLLDQNRVIRPNPWFRMFATTNTIGLGDTTGLYHGTQQINQGQMDRWNIVGHAQLSARRDGGADRTRQVRRI